MEINVFFATPVTEIESSWPRPDGYVITKTREEVKTVASHSVFKPRNDTWYQFGTTVPVMLSNELIEALNQSDRGFLYTDLCDEDFELI